MANLSPSGFQNLLLRNLGVESYMTHEETHTLSGCKFTNKKIHGNVLGHFYQREKFWSP